MRRNVPEEARALVVNHLWEKLDAGLIGIHNAFPFVGDEKLKEEKSQDAIVTPLQVSEMADKLKWTSREVRRIIGSLQITPEDAPRHPIHVGRRTARPIFFAPGKLEVLLNDFVVDYQNGSLEDRLQEAGAVTATLDTDATVPTPGYPLENSEKSATHPQAGTVASVSSVANSAMRPSVASVAESEEKEDGM